MIRIITSGARLAAFLLAAAALPALAQSSASSLEPDPLQPSSEQSSVPDELQGFIGDWILEQQDESLPKCPLKFTDTEAVGGWAIEMPEACPAPYPAADKFVAWNVDDADGSITILDAARNVTMRLMEDEDGLFDTTPDVEPRFYLLAPYDEDGTGGEADSD